MKLQKKGCRKTVIDNSIRKRYGQIPSKHSAEISEIKVGEPTFVDPNSFTTCSQILRKIGTEAGIERYGTGKHQWVIICCDGLPFRFCHNIINDIYVCLQCNIPFFRDEEIGKHNEEHHREEKATYCKEFDWVLLKPAERSFRDELDQGVL